MSLGIKIVSLSFFFCFWFYFNLCVLVCVDEICSAVYQVVTQGGRFVWWGVRESKNKMVTGDTRV